MSGVAGPLSAGHCGRASKPATGGSLLSVSLLSVFLLIGLVCSCAAPGPATTSRLAACTLAAKSKLSQVLHGTPEGTRSMAQFFVDLGRKDDVARAVESTYGSDWFALPPERRASLLAVSSGVNDCQGGDPTLRDDAKKVFTLRVLTGTRSIPPLLQGVLCLDPQSDSFRSSDTPAPSVVLLMRACDPSSRPAQAAISGQWKFTRQPQACTNPGGPCSSTQPIMIRFDCDLSRCVADRLDQYWEPQEVVFDGAVWRASAPDARVFSGDCASTLTQIELSFEPTSAVYDGSWKADELKGTIDGQALSKHSPCRDAVFQYRISGTRIR